MTRGTREQISLPARTISINGLLPSGQSPAGYAYTLAHVMIVGYQGYGSLGRKLVERHPVVRIRGEGVVVRCTASYPGRLQRTRWSIRFIELVFCHRAQQAPPLPHSWRKQAPPDNVRPDSETIPSGRPHLECAT